MKMPEKYDLLAAILGGKEQGDRGVKLRLQWRTFGMADIMAARLQNSNRMQRCAIIA